MRGPLVPRLETTAMAVAYALRHFAEVEVVGAKILQGVRLTYLEVDGVPVPVPEEPAAESPGIRITWPDGKVWLYLLTDKTRAESVLARARVLREEGGS